MTRPERYSPRPRILHFRISARGTDMGITYRIGLILAAEEFSTRQR